MFTGIVDRVGTVRAATRLGGAIRLDLETGYGDLVLGESVAVAGVCLTVVESDASGQASFYVSGETLARANLERVAAGAPINLERAVTLSTRLSGHLVQGHVDGLARLTSIDDAGESRRWVVSLPSMLRPYCVEKGSIALDGVSLTLNKATPIEADDRFLAEVNLIPHTLQHTSFNRSSIGDEFNVEVDVIARYVEQLCHGYLKR